jgi:hypothetical protein
VFDGTSYFVGWTRAEGTYYADSARYLGRFELPTDGSPPVSVTPFDLLSSAANARELGASMALENGVIYWAYYKSVNDAYLQTVPITTCAP